VCGFNYDAFGTPMNVDPTNPNTANTSSWAFFNSRHTGNILNFLMADGSVQHISTSVDWATWLYLCGFEDGNPVSF
jgi:prepilin-type processing-associated H-X9-DG protein